jgi:putative transposase
MTVDFCLEAVEAAIRDYGVPEILNTDQGSQFTGTDFVELVQQHGIQISMDGKGSWRDNVFVERLWKSLKYEKVYLHAYDSVAEARQGLQRYFSFYNQRRPHSALDGRTPDMVYFAALPSLRQPNVNPAELHLKSELACPTSRSQRSPLPLPPV